MRPIKLSLFFIGWLLITCLYKLLLFAFKPVRESGYIKYTHLVAVGSILFTGFVRSKDGLANPDSWLHPVYAGGYDINPLSWLVAFWFSPALPDIKNLLQKALP